MVPVLIESIVVLQLSKVNPQPHYSGQQQQAKDHVDGMLPGCLVRGFALWNANGNGFHFVFHSRERKSGETLAIGSRGHQADSNKYNGANHEHENRVVEEIHINKPADSGRAKVTAAGAIRNLQNETGGPQYKAGHERRNGARSVHTWPQDSQDKASGNRRADISLNALQVNIELAADEVDKGDPQQAEQHHHARSNAAKIYQLLL